MHARLLLAAMAAAALGGAAVAAAPAYIAAAVADKSRPPEQIQRDPERKPAEMLEFAGVTPGMTVVDLLPGRFYFTRLFAKAVGPSGRVYAVNPPSTPRANPANPPAAPIADPIESDPAYANVKELAVSLTQFALPVKADLVWTSQNYHDLHNVSGLDMIAFNKAVFDALKPGGTYVVLDHVASPGDPKVTETLHRIDPAVVRREVEAAGFRFEGESRALANPADNHTLKVFDPTVRGHTDQFIYKFRKPG